MDETPSLPLNPKKIINKFLLEVATWKTPDSYTVKPGDNLWNIVINYFPENSISVKGYKTETIAKIIGLIVSKNEIKDPSLIHPGQKIKLPTPNEVSKISMPTLSSVLYDLFEDTETLAAFIDLLKDSPKPKKLSQKANENIEKGLIRLRELQDPHSRHIKLP